MILKPDIKLYPTLVNSQEFTIAWKDIDTFDCSSLSNEELKIIDRITGIELSFDSSKNSIDEISRTMLRVINSSCEYQTSLLVRELSQPMSKIRSYKGLVKSLKKTDIDFLEKEYLTGEGSSFFASMVNVRTLDWTSFQKLFFNWSESFVLVNYKEKADAIDFAALEDTFYKYYDEKLGFRYLRLVMKFCGYEEKILLRAGGDGGRSNLALQYFVPKEYSAVFLKQIKSVLKLL